MKMELCSSLTSGGKTTVPDYIVSNLIHFAIILFNLGKSGINPTSC